MKKKFLGLSDDGYRVYTLWTPGEKGDCGIVMTVGYRGDEFTIYDSEAWLDEKQQQTERQAQFAADETRAIVALMGQPFSLAMGGSFVSGGSIHRTAKSNYPKGNPLIVKTRQMDFAGLELKVNANLLEPIIYWDEYSAKNPKITVSPDQQGQPKRKPQPNRGPRGRKDWK